MRDLVDARAGFRWQRGQLEVEALQLRLADGFESLAQGDDGRNRVAGSEPRGELVDLFGDDAFRTDHFARAPGEILADRRLEIVDVVEEHLFDLAGRGFDVARDGDIDDEQRAAAPPAHDALDMRLRENRRGRAGRGDDDVARADRRVQLVPRRGAGAADRLGRSRGVRHRPADDRHMLHALRLHVQGRQLAHFARADDEHVPPGEVAEDLARQGHGRVAHRHRARTEAGFRPHALADRERTVEEPVEHGADGARIGRDRMGVLHLAENLRLPDHERVETGRHAEQMPGRVDVADVVDVRCEIGARKAVEVADEADQVVARRLDVVAGDVELGAVAGGEHDGFTRGAARSQHAERFRNAARLKVDALAHVDRRGAVTHSYQEKVHNGR